MVRSNNGHLSRYVKRVMKQNGLSLRDIEIRSEARITDGYVAEILRGTAANPSAEKIKALAVGLGVDPHALFDVICGPFEPAAAHAADDQATDTVDFLEAMQEVAANSELINIVEEAIQLTPEECAVVLKSLQSINKRRGKNGRRKRSRRRKE